MMFFPRVGVSREFGFPGFHGENMHAWIDCMSCLDEPDSGMTSVHVPKGGVPALHLDDFDDLHDRCPEICDELISWSAFVNFCQTARGEAPLPALSYSRAWS